MKYDIVYVPSPNDSIESSYLIESIATRKEITAKEIKNVHVFTKEELDAYIDNYVKLAIEVHELNKGEHKTYTGEEILELLKPPQ